MEDKGSHFAKVLVVDDQPAILKLLTKHFESQNFEVISADNADSVFNQLNLHNDIDLIVLDIVMPGISGFDICRKVREKYSLFELPLIFLTSKVDIDDKVAGFEAGANDFVSKPFDHVELIARSKNLVRLKKLTKANEALSRAVELKNQFLQMNIHDLKNPMTTIQILTEMLKTNEGNDADTIENLDLILQSTSKVLELVNELLELSKIEGGRVSIHKEKTDFTQIVIAAIENNMPGALRKSQSIYHAKDFPAEIVLNIDTEKMFRVVDNLISNAVKYSPFESEIETKSLLLNSGLNKKVLRFEVSDSGPGIKPEEFSKLFTVFGKLSVKPTGGESSSGLGLAIAKHFVEMHEGRIWAESGLLKGTKFILEIPANII